MALLDKQFLRKLEQLAFVIRRLRAGSEGSRASGRSGGLIEFSDYRNYAPGEDYRRLDWSVYARLEKLFVKEFAREETARVSILLDASASMGLPEEKWNFARKLAAALGYAALAGHNQMQLHVAAGGRLQSSPVFANTAGILAVFSFLEQLRPGGASDLGASLQLWLSQQRGAGMALVISDFLDDSSFKKLLPFARSRRHDVSLFQVLSPQEIHPPFDGRTKLTDAETGQAVHLYWDAQTLEHYQRLLADWQAQWRQLCAAHRIAWFSASSAQSLEEAVIHYLRGGRIHA